MIAWPLDTIGGRLRALMGLPREPEPAPDPHVIAVLAPDRAWPRWEYIGPFPTKRAAELYRAAELGRRDVEIAPLVDPSRWRA